MELLFRTTDGQEISHQPGGVHACTVTYASTGREEVRESALVLLEGLSKRFVY